MSCKKLDYNMMVWSLMEAGLHIALRPCSIYEAFDSIDIAPLGRRDDGFIRGINQKTVFSMILDTTIYSGTIPGLMEAISCGTKTSVDFAEYFSVDHWWKVNLQEIDRSVCRTRIRVIKTLNLGEPRGCAEMQNR